MPFSFLQLKVLTPSKVFCSLNRILWIVAEGRSGSFGIMPNRLDCVASLKPGLLTYSTEEGKEDYIALDEGVLVKVGSETLISVRRAVGGVDLGQLRKTIENEFLAMDAVQKSVRTAVAKLESNLIRRFAEFHYA